MKAWIWKYGPGWCALIGWGSLFYWGWQPPMLAGAVIVLAWIDGYVNGKEDQK